MNLKCKINGKEYPIVQGNTFSDEFNETLDSGTIIISQVERIEGVKPYDDVYIYDNKFNGYGNNIINNNKFYKHLLVQDINRDEIRLENKKKFQYTVLLWSETKFLETIPLPNFSVTQPLEVNLKKSVYEYIVDIVDMYSPLYKVTNNENETTWKYEKKYTIDSSLKDIFGDVYSPDFTLNNPNLRDVLSQLMMVKDMIPYVQDGVIKAMDITQRKGEFNTRGVNYIKSNLSGSNYCTSLKRTYSDALSEQKSCRLTEYLSFRNSNNALLTIDNMRIETTYPIYKINKLYMCYYKKIRIKKISSEDYVEKTFLCKQDISKLVKLNSERNVLSEDWSEFNYSNIESVDDLAKFKIGTIGYDIGSKSIDGWGTKYTSYLLFNWFPQANTYVQKVFEFMDSLYPYGIYNYIFLINNSEIKYDEIIELVAAKDGGLVSPFKNEYPAGLKGLMFEIEYEPFYNGTIYHSKDNLDRDDIVINDNSSSSLTLLEQDGIMQKEKINRFGNEIIQFSARYKDINELQELGSVYNSEDGKDTDIIIYSREYAIQDNVINCRYIGAKDYVLKNYFTSVYAKHRPYNLMSYAESVYRAENRKLYVLLSFDKKIVEDNDKVLTLNNFGEEYVAETKTKNSTSIWKILSFLKSTLVNQKMNFLNFDKVNYGFYEFEGKKYVSDVNVFTSADSLCFNLKMYDNVGAGVYIDAKNIEPFENLKDVLQVEDDVKGSLQEWYLTVDDIKTGFVEKMSFYVGHIDKQRLIPDGIVLDVDDVIGKSEELFNAIKTEQLENGNQISVVGVYYEVLNNEAVYKNVFDLPKIDVDYTDIKNLIGNEYILKKDNKELIDMTFQLEPITDSEKIVFSPWMMRLSDLNGNYNKFHKVTIVPGDENSYAEVPIKYYETTLVRPVDPNVGGSPHYNPLMIISINEENLNKNSDGTVSLEESFEKSEIINCPISFSFVNNETLAFDGIGINSESIIKKMVYNMNKIKYYDKENGVIGTEGVQQISYYNNKTLNILNIKKVKESVEEKQIIFKMVEGDNYRGIKIPEGEKWFIFDTTQENLDFVGTKPQQHYVCSNGKKVLFDYFSTGVMPAYDTLDDSNSIISESFFVGVKDFPYPQNMFVTTSNEPMKKHHVYNQYKDLREIGLSDYNTGPLVSDVFYFVDDDKLVVDLYNFEHKMNEVKSVQLWYRDEGGALNFVFGVNVDEEDFNKRRLEIHISLITHKDMRVFDKFHNVIGEVKNVANSEDVDDLTKQKYEKYIEK